MTISEALKAGKSSGLIRPPRSESDGRVNLLVLLHLTGRVRFNLIRESVGLGAPKLEH